MGDVCPCLVCFDKAPGLASGTQLSVEGFGLISHDAQDALSFQLPPNDISNDRVGDSGALSPSKNLDFFPSRGLFQTTIVPGQEAGRPRPAKRRRLKPITNTSTNTILKTAEIISLLTEAFQLDDTFSTPEFKRRMSQLKQLLEEAERTSQDASVSLATGQSMVSRSVSSTPLMRNGVLADQAGPSAFEFSGFSSTPAQPAAAVSSVTGSRWGQRQRDTSPPTAEMPIPCISAYSLVVTCPASRKVSGKGTKKLSTGKYICTCVLNAIFGYRT
jgi:hypothetical protein